jgi:hypothetical protein
MANPHRQVAPMIGIMMSATRDATIAPKATPITTPMARSTTWPRLSMRARADAFDTGHRRWGRLRSENLGPLSETSAGVWNGTVTPARRGAGRVDRCPCCDGSYVRSCRTLNKTKTGACAPVSVTLLGGRCGDPSFAGHPLRPSSPEPCPIQSRSAGWRPS